MAQYNNGYPAPAGVGPYGQPVLQYPSGMNTVGATPPLSGCTPNAAPRTAGYQQPVQPDLSAGLLGRPVSSREEFLAIPSDLYGRPIYCPDLRNGVIYYKRLNPDTCESEISEYYSPDAWHAMQQAQAAQQAQMQAAMPTQQYVSVDEYNQLVDRLNKLENELKKSAKPVPTAKKGETI